MAWGDAGYQGVHKREENLALEVAWRVAMRPGKRRNLDPGGEEGMGGEGEGVGKSGELALHPDRGWSTRS